jgi:hypothetical protein
MLQNPDGGDFSVQPFQNSKITLQVGERNFVTTVETLTESIITDVEVGLMISVYQLIEHVLESLVRWNFSQKYVVRLWEDSL